MPEGRFHGMPYPPLSSPTPEMLRDFAARAGGFALLFVIAAGCAHQGPRSTKNGSSAPAVRVRSDEDYARLRANYEVLAVTDPARAANRTGLSRYIRDEVRAELAAGRCDEAWEIIQRAFSLWDPEELRAPAPDDELAAVAAELERAFGRRGAHHEALALLAVEIALHPSDKAAPARFNEVVHWLRGDGAKDVCIDRNCEQLIEDFEVATAAFPSPFLVETLAALYWQRQAGAGRLAGDGAGGGGLAQLMANRAVSRAGADLARLYLRVSRPDLALQALQKLAGQIGEDPQLLASIARYLAPGGRPIDGVSIAAAFARDPASRSVGERICIDVARRFPDAIEPQICIGELSIQLEHITVSIRAFEKARQLAPERRQIWESLARLHQARLAQLAGDDRTDQLETELAKVEAFHQEAAKRFAADPLHTSLAGALFEAGRGLYNAGRIDDAVRLFLRSQATQPRPDTYEQRALIELKRERGPEAVALFKEGIEFVKQRRSDAQQQAYWLGKLNHGLGDAYEQIGSAKEAVEARRRSLDAWDLLLVPRLEPDEAAEAEIERGKVLYALGEHEKATAGFERALELSAERGATYADLLAFLVPRGERNEAGETFHRAIGRTSISEYLKVYCSLWIVELDRRSGEPVDPVAEQYLASVSGAKWYHDLARWASGRITEAELATHADTPGKRCEADFYIGLRRLDERKPDQAQALFRKVMGSQMMAFFEFDMAYRLLRHPPPVAPEKARPSDAKPSHANNQKNGPK